MHSTIHPHYCECCDVWTFSIEHKLQTDVISFVVEMCIVCCWQRITAIPENLNTFKQQTATLNIGANAKDGIVHTNEINKSTVYHSYTVLSCLNIVLIINT